MFGKKKNEAASTVENDDIFYLLSLIADKVGVDLDDKEESEEVETEEKEEVVDEEVDNSFEAEEKEEKEVVNEETTDKRKLIDEIGGILKGKVDEELWRTIIGKIEKLSYEGSETSEKDNACKNEMEDVEKEQVKTGEEKIKEEVKEDDKIEKAYKNSIMGFNNTKAIMSRSERIAKANEKYSLN